MRFHVLGVQWVFTQAEARIQTVLLRMQRVDHDTYVEQIPRSFCWLQEDSIHYAYLRCAALLDRRAMAKLVRKTQVKGKSLQTRKPPRMTMDEKRLVREMHWERGMRPSEIARVVGRDLSSICRHLAQMKTPKPVGRPKALSVTQIDRIVKTLEGMIIEASAGYEVTLPMVMRRCRVKACERVVADALHARGY